MKLNERYFDCLAANGPNLEGCNDCNKSKYKCCFDNKTQARGLTADNKLDCPCEATEFGCCPDRLTEAKGIFLSNDF